MARQPAQLLTEAGANIAKDLGALTAAALIVKPDEHAQLCCRMQEVVGLAMGELGPAGFRELLNRTRDRKAALQALKWISKERVSRWSLDWLLYAFTFSMTSVSLPSPMKRT